ncbi:Ig-like domain-containing protein [Armatimonas sp.]|uniref:Ig-like domain-containing protein n=1 Tax=Armatimonas sp. TaxID=1872638 RepID=UPI00375375C1
MTPRAGQSTTLRWVPGPQGSNRASVEGSGLPDKVPLKVFAGEQRETPMAGTYRVRNGTQIFEPRFSLLPGTTYYAISGTASASFRLPARIPVPPTRVVQVYPTADTVPVNLLKFYLHFSAPMSRGDSYRHIRLLKAGGQPVELPFLELAEELWNPAMTRLTLLFDPGRIKRGVKPLEDIGGALEVGKRYTLEIASRWQDGQGAPLAAPFRKAFLVGVANRTAIEPSRWRITSPKAGSRSPLVVVFNQPLDHALAQRLLTVEGVRGTIALDDHERRWRFTPDKPWQHRRYTLRVSPLLEDLAGNNIGKTFDVDTTRHPALFRSAPLRLQFTPR